MKNILKTITNTYFLSICISFVMIAISSCKEQTFNNDEDNSSFIVKHPAFLQTSNENNNHTTDAISPYYIQGVPVSENTIFLGSCTPENQIILAGEALNGKNEIASCNKDGTFELKIQDANKTGGFYQSTYHNETTTLKFFEVLLQEDNNDKFDVVREMAVSVVLDIEPFEYNPKIKLLTTPYYQGSINNREIEVACYENNQRYLITHPLLKDGKIIAVCPNDVEPNTINIVETNLIETDTINQSILNNTTSEINADTVATGEIVIADSTNNENIEGNENIQDTENEQTTPETIYMPILLEFEKETEVADLAESILSIYTTDKSGNYAKESIVYSHLTIDNTPPTKPELTTFDNEAFTTSNDDIHILSSYKPIYVKCQNDNNENTATNQIRNDTIIKISNFYLKNNPSFFPCKPSDFEKNYLTIRPEFTREHVNQTLEISKIDIAGNSSETTELNNIIIDLTGPVGPPDVDYSDLYNTNPIVGSHIFKVGCLEEGQYITITADKPMVLQNNPTIARCLASDVGKLKNNIELIFQNEESESITLEIEIYDAAYNPSGTPLILDSLTVIKGNNQSNTDFKFNDYGTDYNEFLERLEVYNSYNDPIPD